MVLKTKNLFKLITHEDNYNIHKTLGIICLLNFIYQFGCLFCYGSMDLKYNLNTPSILSFHGLLSLTSFIFRVPQNRHKGAPMIYKEFRLHSIVFALRSVFCAFAFYFKLDLMYNIIIINLTMVAADLATLNYKAATKTMRGMPFGKNLSEPDKKEVTDMHSSQQFGATIFMITNIDAAFAPLLAIQIAAFLMTLVRKSIISELDWHRLYAISLWLNIFVYWSFSTNPILSLYVIYGVYIFYYARITYRFNKYIIWNAILFSIYYFEKKIKNNNYFAVEIDQTYIKLFLNLIIIGYLVKNIYKTKSLWY